MLDDGCGNTLDIVAESTLGKKKIIMKILTNYIILCIISYLFSTENCCPPSCLADNVDDEFKSRFIKAHQFDD